MAAKPKRQGAEPGATLQRSRAPVPIEPLPGSAGPVLDNVPPAPARWEKWRHMAQVELWQAVALTLSYEPESLPIYLRAHALGDDPFRICPPDYRERLEIASSNAGAAFWVVVTHPLRARALVDLSVFANWARGVWDLPEQLLLIGRPQRSASVPAPAKRQPGETEELGLELQPIEPRAERSETFAGDGFGDSGHVQSTTTPEAAPVVRQWWEISRDIREWATDLAQAEYQATGKPLSGKKASVRIAESIRQTEETRARSKQIQSRELPSPETVRDRLKGWKFIPKA